MSEKIDNKFVTMDINGVLGVGIQPFDQPTKELLDLVKGRKRALFIDLAATPQMHELLRLLSEVGVDIASYRDHHYSPDSTNPRDLEVVRSADQIKEQLGDKARFDLRKNAPSCSRLVELGEALREKIDLILHHGDTDGYLAYLKACGIFYPGLEDDADILDSRGDESKLTEHGRLYRDALVSLPSFDPKKPDIFNKAKQVLQMEFLSYIQGNFSEDVSRPLKERAQAVLEQAQTTEELIKIAQILEGGIAFVDTTVVNGRKYDPKKLSDALEKISGVRLTAQKKNIGPLVKGDNAQVTICRLSSDKETDLRRYLPEGAESGVEHGRIFNTLFLLHVREDLFSDFIDRFKQS